MLGCIKAGFIIEKTTCTRLESKTNTKKCSYVFKTDKLSIQKSWRLVINSKETKSCKTERLVIAFIKAETDTQQTLIKKMPLQVSLIKIIRFEKQIQVSCLNC